MIKRDIATWTRWLHIYLSMFSFTSLLFFAVTGITLNHPDWFIRNSKPQTFSSKVNSEWVKGNDTLSVNKLAVVEHLRNEYHIKAPVASFTSDESQCTVTFKGPGYSADAFIERETGKYDVTIVAPGSIAIFNDLHKARDTRPAWAVIVDISALLMILVSVTGFIMIFYLKKKRAAGLLLFVAGSILLMILYYLFA